MINFLQKAVLWIGAIFLAFIPGVIALDSGGVLPWSYWALSAALILPAICSFAALRGQQNPTGLQPQWLTLILITLGLYALFQTVALPSGLTKVLSPGSYAAWTQWLPEQVSESSPYGVDKGMPISVAPFFTRQYAWILFTMAAAAWCGAMLFSSRERVVWLLIAFSMIGTVHALLGLWQVFSFPNYTTLGVSAEHPFGVFVNRNNASALFNLSLACSLGLLGWRLAAVTGHEFGQHGFSFSSLFDLAADRPSIFAFAGVFTNMAGLLACGSRGGFGGTIVGVVFGLGMLKVSGILPKLFSTLLVIAVLAGVLLFSVEVTPRSLDRFGAMADGFNDSILTDNRLPHWKDSVTAARHYLPMGAGMGTYRYAYLPYQEMGADRWFMNADNLWLEWLVEGGLVAILLVLAAVVLLTYSLYQIRNTPDPMDHGMATAGWVALFAIAFSQIFDFGMLLAGSSVLASILFGAVLGRASTEGVPLLTLERKAGKRLKFAERNRGWGALSIGLLSVALLLLASSGLYQSAYEDAVLRSARIALEQDEDTDDVLKQLDRLQQSGTINPEVTYQKAQVLGRRAEVAMQKRILDLPELKSIMGDKPNSTFGSVRRLNSELRINGELEIDADLKQQLVDELQLLYAQGTEEDLQELRELVIDSLSLAPLSSESRLALLDFTLDPENAPIRQQLYEQILRLRRGTSRSLGSLARLAVQNGDWETATSAYKSLVSHQPRRVKLLLEDAQQVGHPDPIQIVPDDERAILGALEYQYRYLPPSPEFYARAVEVLTREFPENRTERSARYQQIAGLYSRLKETDKAYDYYLKAIDLDPMDLQARLSYVDTLAENGELVQAKRYTEGIKEIFGENNSSISKTLSRLTKMISKSNKIGGAE